MSFAITYIYNSIKFHFAVAVFNFNVYNNAFLKLFNKNIDFPLCKLKFVVINKEYNINIY